MEAARHRQSDAHAGTVRSRRHASRTQRSVRVSQHQQAIRGPGSGKSRGTAGAARLDSHASTSSSTIIQRGTSRSLGSTLQPALRISRSRSSARSRRSATRLPPTLQIARSVNVLHSSWGYHSPCARGSGETASDGRRPLPSRLRVGPQCGARNRRRRCTGARVPAADSSSTFRNRHRWRAGRLRSRPDGGGNHGGQHAATSLRSRRTGDVLSCRDGYVYLWMSEPGHWNGMWTLMGEPTWMREYPERWLELHLTQERIDRCRAEIARWMKDQDKSESRSRAQKLGVPLVPVNTMEDVFQSSQMQFRKFFTQIEHPSLGKLHYPTVPYRLSGTPARDRTSPRRCSGKTPIRCCAKQRRSSRRASCNRRLKRIPSGTSTGAACGTSARRAGSGSDEDLGGALHRQAAGISRRRGHQSRELRLAGRDTRLRQQGHQRCPRFSGYQPR